MSDRCATFAIVNSYAKMTSEPFYPVGIQSFSEIRRLNAVYVDKTDLVYKLTHSSKYVFLSRPRRFGKTLLASTLQFYFEGRKELFDGLAMEHLEHDWIKYPVLRFDFSTPKGVAATDIERVIALKMQDFEELYGRNELEKTVGERLNGLIKRVYLKTGKPVVIIIDEYDALMLDVLPMESELAAVRRVMRDFYSPLKACDDYLKFVFITGISAFSQLSIFSELNNLEIISQSQKYSTICGITKQELIDNFQYGITKMAGDFGCSTDEIINKLIDRYDGYHFCGNSEGVFNPFSLLNALENSDLGSYWFSSGTPTFLVEMLRKHNADRQFSIEDLEDGKPVSLSRFNTSLELQTGPMPLLYQSGYITIKSYNKESGLYTLGIPNSEVRVGLLKNLLPLYSTLNPEDALDASKSISYELKNGNIDAALTQMQALLSSVPYMRGDRGILADEEKTEAYYHRLFFIIFKMLHRDVNAEVHSARGAADITIFTPKFIYIVELKIDSSADAALRQIDEKGYAEPYLADGRKVLKLGINFSTHTRTLSEWKQQ
jgi:hypothetical protein